MHSKMMSTSSSGSPLDESLSDSRKGEKRKGSSSRLADGDYPTHSSTHESSYYTLGSSTDETTATTLTSYGIRRNSSSSTENTLSSSGLRRRSCTSTDESNFEERVPGVKRTRVRSDKYRGVYSSTDDTSYSKSDENCSTSDDESSYEDKVRSKWTASATTDESSRTYCNSESNNDFYTSTGESSYSLDSSSGESSYGTSEAHHFTTNSTDDRSVGDIVGSKRMATANFPAGTYYSYYTSTDETSVDYGSFSEKGYYKVSRAGKLWLLPYD